MTLKSPSDEVVSDDCTARFERDIEAYTRGLAEYYAKLEAAHIEFCRNFYGLEFENGAK